MAIPTHFSSLIPKMSMFNLAFSCLTMTSLPWFMVLTFKVPMQYSSLQDQTLLSPPDTYTTESHFCIGPAPSFFLELSLIALCSSPVTCWTPTDLGGSTLGVITFCFFIVFTGFSQQDTTAVVCTLCQVWGEAKKTMLKEASLEEMTWIVLKKWTLRPEPAQ